MYSDIVAIHVLVEGRVQGVGFRYYVMNCVGTKEIKGWVRNLQDGRVEVLAEGSKKDLTALLEEIQRGPNTSRVTKTIPNWEDASGELESFRAVASSSHSR